MSLNAAERKLVQHDNDIAAIYSIVSRIERKQKRFDKRLGKVEGRLGRVEDGLGRVESQLAVVIDLVSRREKS